jgi:hypothetical protein
MRLRALWPSGCCRTRPASSLPTSRAGANMNDADIKRGHEHRIAGGGDHVTPCAGAGIERWRSKHAGTHEVAEDGRHKAGPAPHRLTASRCCSNNLELSSADAAIAAPALDRRLFVSSMVVCAPRTSQGPHAQRTFLGCCRAGQSKCFFVKRLASAVCRETTTQTTTKTQQRGIVRTHTYVCVHVYSTNKRQTEKHN